MNAWLSERFGILFLQPEWLWLLLALPLAWGLRCSTPAPALLFAPARLLPTHGVALSLRQRFRALPLILLSLGIALLALALARPCELVVQPRRSLGVDLMLAIDRSSSMDEMGMDRQRSRIEVVKAAAAEFVAGREQDRIGLLAFARYPDLLCAPTSRTEALLASLTGINTVEVDGPEDLTGIGGAAARGAEILRRAPGPSRVLVLLSDGEENVAGAHAPQALTPAEAAELCSAWGVRVHAIAAGSRESEARRDLQDLAQRTGGSFHFAEDAGALQRIYRAIDELEASPLAEPELRVQERGGWVALLAIGVVAAGAGLRRRGWEAGP